MTSKSKVYVAGIGYSPSPSNGSAKASVASLISAATKALLDAGVTYDDVAQGVTTARSQGSETFKAFDEGGVEVDEVENGSEIKASYKFIEDRGIRCVLTIVVEKSAAIALVLVSSTFLWSHPYLQDSAALIRLTDASQSKSEGEGLYDLCQIVWALRGWSQQTKQEKRLSCKGRSSQRFELTRADAQKIPDWKEVEHKQDGKHRLGYNPVTETKDISQEDFEAVSASDRTHREVDERTQFKRKGGDRAALAKL